MAQIISLNGPVAVKLKKPRKINGTDFDGTQDINPPATSISTTVPANPVNGNIWIS